MLEKVHPFFFPQTDLQLNDAAYLISVLIQSLKNIVCFPYVYRRCRHSGSCRKKKHDGLKMEVSENLGENRKTPTLRLYLFNDN